MYPLTLVRLSRNKYVSLELKNNKKARGYLKKCDLYMNLHFSNLTVEDEESSVFYKECLLRGTSIKTVNVDHSLLYIQNEK
jgi:small nuclear ribonucleoprotein (snRNP)-like protein